MYIIVNMNIERLLPGPLGNNQYFENTIKNTEQLIIRSKLKRKRDDVIDDNIFKHEAWVKMLKCYRFTPFQGEIPILGTY